jgi:signal transduction histidine kinase
MMSCIHSNEMEGGCGTSEHCTYCGAVLSIIESQEQNEPVTHECRISSVINEEQVSFDLSVTSSPLVIEGEKFTLFVANDISDEKRRHVMERIFFHDVINKAGSLHGLLDLLEESDDIREIKTTLKILHTVSSDLLEEILSQRDLAGAEKGAVHLNPAFFDAEILMIELAAQMRAHSVTRNRTIATTIPPHSIPICTDRTLLNRILTNMIKNALEATPDGGTIALSLRDNGESAAFSVHNDSVMSEAVRSQVFQRSFSTKGADRGLGTYSMKLLGEKFLMGKVSFNSEKQAGTDFTIEVPKEWRIIGEM